MVFVFYVSGQRQFTFQFKRHPRASCRNSECNFRAPAHGYGSNFNMETDAQAVFGARLVRDIESCAERRAFYQGRTYGMNGMTQGYDPHMLDAANLAKL